MLLNSFYTTAQANFDLFKIWHSENIDLGEIFPINPNMEMIAL